MNRKVLFPIFSRGNYAKLKNVILYCKKNYKNIDPIVIVGGTANLDKFGDLCNDLILNNIEISEKINFVVSGENIDAMNKTAALACLDFSIVMKRFNPDLVVIVADRFECLPLAMIARYSNKCIVHLEGGEITGSVDDSIRHSISKLSNYHFVANKFARNILISQGENDKNIFITGSTSFDEFIKTNKLKLDKVRKQQLVSGLGEILSLKEKNYVVCIFHPVTTEYEENFKNCDNLIRALKDVKFEIVWIWPNMDAGTDGVSKAIRIARENKFLNNIHFFKSLPIEKYAPLLKYAKFIIGNSSSGIREAGFVGTPAVNIGNRQKGREFSQNVIHTSNDLNEIKKSLKKITKLKTQKSSLYSGILASQKVATLLNKIEIVHEKFFENK